ncbi:MAG: hypothetical protein IKD27_05345 [Oscillospiraceae bacterium]|nr:hypothetical protein [Oscillospiraceae bacterium]
MKRTISLILIVALWAGLAAFAWLRPASASSDAERRPLAQFPEVSGESILSGDFMGDFADYAVDQFPMRDSFRTLNAYLSYYLLGKTDNNGIYLHDGYAAKMEYPMDEQSVNSAISRFTELYEKYLTDCDIRFALVPDKGYYLAEQAGALSMDYDALYEKMAEALPWAELIDLRSSLSVESYYRTDTHWRQEAIVPAAEKIAASLGVTVPEFAEKKLDRPFYGVYYGQAALPMEPDTIHYLTNDVLENCTVKCHDNGQTAEVYDMTKLSSRDLYDIFLSGGAAVLEITNPAADPDKELIVFRDSFGSSMVPLLLNDYGRVWVLDTRYVSPAYLGQFVDFADQDVLFLYSTLILNASGVLRK